MLLKKKILGSALVWKGHSCACNDATPIATCTTDDNWPMPSLCYPTAVTVTAATATTCGAVWAEPSQTPAWEQVASGQRLQGWYADPQSTGLKFQCADAKGLLGVGSWYRGCGGAGGFKAAWQVGCGQKDAPLLLWLGVWIYSFV